jgi:hypothetical protein
LDDVLELALCITSREIAELLPPPAKALCLFVSGAKRSSEEAENIWLSQNIGISESNISH